MSIPTYSPAVQAAIRSAADLNDTDTTNGEYLRGQVELICSLFGLDSDDHRDALSNAVRVSTTSLGAEYSLASPEAAAFIVKHASQY